jgi:hypothetical protein
MSSAIFVLLICFAQQTLAMDPPPREVFLKEDIGKFSESMFAEMSEGELSYEKALIKNIDFFFPAQLGAPLEALPMIFENICLHIRDEEQQKLYSAKIFQRQWPDLKLYEPHTIAEALTYIHVKLLNNAYDEKQLSHWREDDKKNYIKYILDFSGNCQLFFSFLIFIDSKNYLKLFHHVAEELEKMRNYYGLFIIYFTLYDYEDKLSPRQTDFFNRLKSYNFDSLIKESLYVPHDGAILLNYSPYLHWYFGSYEKKNKTLRKEALAKLALTVRGAKNYNLKENALAKILIKLPKLPAEITNDLKIAARLKLEQDKNSHYEILPCYASKPLKKWDFKSLASYVLDNASMEALIALCLAGIHDGSQIDELLSMTKKNKIKLLTTLLFIDTSRACSLLETNNSENNMALAFTNSDSTNSSSKRRSSLLKKFNSKSAIPKLINPNAPTSPQKTDSCPTIRGKEARRPSLPPLKLEKIALSDSESTSEN